MKEAGRYIQRKGVFADVFFKEAKKIEVTEFISSFQTTFGDFLNILLSQVYDSARIFFGIAHSRIINRMEFYSKLKKIKNFPGIPGYTAFILNGDSKKNICSQNKRKKIVENH
jgi:hypothetical protein